MSIKKLLIVLNVLELVVIVTLCSFLYSKWYLPYAQTTEYKNCIKNISTDNVNQILISYQAEKEKEKTLTSIPEKSNEILNGTNWICYTDKSVIAFSENYFIWYKDSNITNDNAMIGQFSYYKGDNVFNMLGDSLQDYERSEDDNVLIIELLSKKEEGEEILETTQFMYLFGYSTGEIMTFIDISSYKEYEFVKINDKETGENNVVASEENANITINETDDG